MKITKGGAAAGFGLMVGALALAGPAGAQPADPAFEHGQPAVTAAPTNQCGQVQLTFSNPTPWLFVFDVRADGAPPHHPSVAPGVEIVEGPLAGQEFGPRWNLIEVDGGAGVHELVGVFGFNETVEVRLAEGAEQKLFFDWQSIDVSGMVCAKPTPAPTPAPSTEPTETPAPGQGGEDEGDLPVTGAPAALIAGGGAAALALGGGLWMLTRRRRITFSA